jgi:phosphoribosylglycinamide formyltransferase-1
VHAAVLEAGVTVSGATVHFVDAQYDTGPILLQEAVSLPRRGETVESLAARVLAVEHRLYPRALQLLVTHEPKFQGKRVELWEK